MLNKSLMIIIFFFTFTQIIFSDELFRLLEDTPVWKSDFLADSTIDRILSKDFLISNVSRPFFDTINGYPSFLNGCFFEETEYYIPVNTFAPNDTEELFDESFLLNADPQSNIWINAYFLDVMRTVNRDVIKPYEKRLVDHFLDDDHERWYDYGSTSTYNSLFITQGTISMGGLAREEFWIRNIKRIKNGYCVTVTWNTSSEIYDQDSKFRSMKVQLPERKKATVFNLFFVLDGDYLDVYYSLDITDLTGSQRTYCTTFASIEAELKEQIYGIITSYDHKPYDPSKITSWPRRADGSMDYPPPSVPAVAQDAQPPAESDETAAADTAAESRDSGKSSLPLWAWLAIGAVVAAGGAVVLIKRKK